MVLGLILSLSSVQAREDFQFSLGDKVRVLSDKAFRKTKENKFEAVGNVIITHGENAIYGEKASMSFNTGETQVIGNVRYVGPNITLHGTELNYNFKDKQMSVRNARIISDNYVVLGKEITRHSNDVITGVNAEYTTCIDCPESWSIFGKKIKITVGEYVRIWHAYIKIKGVVVLYFPYIVLPIKKQRESGLLFPSLAFNFDDGVRFQQPWFWAINDSSDMTLTPSVWGKRGLGSEIQYRQVIKDGLWFEMNHLNSFDKVYNYNKVGKELTGNHFFRHFSNWEHHYNTSSFFNHHVYFDSVRDLDVERDYDFFTKSKTIGSENGGGGFFDFRLPWAQLSIEADHSRNQIFPDASEFDNRYVQVLPEVNLSIMPINFFQSDLPLLNKLSFGFDSEFINFKQNHKSEDNFIRNASRIDLAPYLNWYLGELGPVQVSTNARLDYQTYHFPYEQVKSMTKSGMVYETEFSMTIEKLFGLAYKESVSSDRIDFNKNSKEKPKSEGLGKNLIGKTPVFSGQLVNKEIIREKKSFRHKQEFKLKHYFLSDQKIKGNEDFKNQITQSDSAGQFDYKDAIREQEFRLSQVSSRTSLPLSNTAEIQWNNSIIQKSAKTSNLAIDDRYLRDNFNYERIAYFNLSQGYDFAVETEELEEKLTRLNIATGAKVFNTHFDLNEYYFYSTNEHILSFSMTQNVGPHYFKVGFEYNSFIDPIFKLINTEFGISATKNFDITVIYDYDIELKALQESVYKILYTPLNNCWKMELAHKKTVIDKSFSLNFLINFNDKSFKSLSDFR
ncbi:MAG: LPS-assembly protein [Bacteriovoracaceae bacterium]